MSILSSKLPIPDSTLYDHLTGRQLDLSYNAFNSSSAHYANILEVVRSIARKNPQNEVTRTDLQNIIIDIDVTLLLRVVDPDIPVLVGFRLLSGKVSRSQDQETFTETYRAALMYWRDEIQHFLEKSRINHFQLR